MKTTHLRAVIVVAMVSLAGCSGSNETQVSESPPLASASLNPATGSAAALTSSAGANAASNEADLVKPFRNPFAPPKDPPPPPIVEEPVPEPEPEVPEEPAPEIRQPGVPPKIRLVGFMNIGEPKILVSYRNELETLAVGDTLEDMKVVKIESPELTMLFEEREIKFSLFDQAWRHEGGAASSVSGSRAPNRPRSTRTIRKSSTSASGGTKASELTRAPGGIPGFAPNAGRPPGFEPPTSSVTGSTGGVPTGSPPPGLPGLSSEGGAEIGDGAFPGIPGLEAGDKPRAGILPAFPGGP